MLTGDIGLRELTVEARKLEHGLGGLVLGSLILYLMGMRRMIFQLSGFYCRVPLKRSLKGFYKGSIIGFYNIGALIIRIVWKIWSVSQRCEPLNVCRLVLRSPTCV